MSERPNPVVAEASKSDKESYLDSKSFQAANKMYQLESQGQPVAEALAKDVGLKAMVDKAFADKKWNPTGQTVEQTKFSQPDAVKTNKFGKPMTSWTDNPVSRMWKNETPNADQILAEMSEKPPEAAAEKPAEQPKQPERTPAEIKAEKDDHNARAEQDQDKSKVDAAKILEAWMTKEDDSTKNLSEGGKQEGFNRGTMRQERVINGSTVNASVGLPGVDARALGAAAREADTHGAKDLVDTATQKPSLYSRLFGKKPTETKQNAEVTSISKPKDDQNEIDLAA